MRRFLIPLALAVAVTLATAMLAFRTRGPRADLIWTAGGEVTTLDPALMTALQDGRVAAALFEGLTVWDPRTREVRPGVARAWDVSADGLVYTFHLRPEARWSDGRPVTAGDFDYSWRRALDPKTAAQYAYMLYPIRGAKAYYDSAAKGEGGGASAVGIRPEGPHRLVVLLEQPCAYFLDLAAFSTYLPVRRDCIEAHGKQWTRPPAIISNGAYRLAEWRFRSRMVWEKNPHYWDAPSVALERVELRVFDHPNTALNAYETGAADLTAIVPAIAIQPLLAARGAGRRRDVLHETNLGTYFYRFNCSRPPFSDARVRRALALAVDRRQIIERAARGGQVAAFVLVPPGLPGYQSPAGLREDADEARRLLAEAGYPGGRGLGEPAILINKEGDHGRVAELVQQQWRDRLGLDVRIEQVEWKVFLDTVRRLNYQAARAGWYGDYVDPNTFLDMFVTGGGNNDTGWSDAEYDACIAGAARTTDPAARERAFQRAEAILLRDVPIVPLYFYTTTMLARPGLEGFVPNLMNRVDFALLRWAGRGRGGLP
ncbi:MAG: peptide ABC transporter substrate-binding protein [Planctomycetes bacterium]|nr:peptide ABC transporter substrate-binding protein [Planctomycetota bacterium]